MNSQSMIELLRRGGGMSRQFGNEVADYITLLEGKLLDAGLTDPRLDENLRRLQAERRVIQSAVFLAASSRRANTPLQPAINGVVEAVTALWRSK